jgi:hypothetical protein
MPCPHAELDEGDENPRAGDEADDRPGSDLLDSRGDGYRNDEAGLY